MTTQNANEFWGPWEIEVDSFERALSEIKKIFKKVNTPDFGHPFAWRGQVDASWPLYSSLYRKLAWTLESPPTEKQLYLEEGKILTEVHRWGLHVENGGRLGILPQLATLQHYGAPTRLIDITFNALIGLWFAVEEKWDNGNLRDEDKDGRLIAIDITNRLINEMDDLRNWENDLTRPWSEDKLDSESYKKWSTNTYAWKPPSLNARIAAQNGGFIFGGVPSFSKVGNQTKLQFPKTTNIREDGTWNIDEVRQFTSLAARIHKTVNTQGRRPKNAIYTIRIKASAKKDIRDTLRSLYGYSHSTIYPDYTGFAQFGFNTLKSRPPNTEDTSNQDQPTAETSDTPHPPDAPHAPRADDPTDTAEHEAPEP